MRKGEVSPSAHWRSLYAPVDRDEHHLTCVNCGSTQTLAQCPIHGVQVNAPETSNFQLLFHTLEFFGLCDACRQDR